MLRKVFVADSDAVISLWSLRPQAGVLPVGADAESIDGGQMLSASASARFDGSHRRFR